MFPSSLIWWASDAPASPVAPFLPPVCVSSLIWLSPARRCYTTSGFAHKKKCFLKQTNKKTQRNEAVLMVTKKHHQQRNAVTSPVQRAQSSEIKEEVHLLHHTGIHKYAQYITCGIPSWSVHRISLWHVDSFFFFFIFKFFTFCRQGASLHIVSAQHSTIVTRETMCLWY